MDTEALHQQLASLERRFRRLQCAVGMILLVLAASILMAQTASNRVVTANEFVLKDEGGVTRARLHFENGFAGLSIYDAANRRRAHLGEEWGAGAVMEMYSGNDADLRIVTLRTATTGNELHLSRKLLSEIDLTCSFLGSNSIGGLFVVPGEPHLQMSSDRKQIALEMSSPSISVTDSDGFQSQMGASDLVTVRTGTTSKTSAASLVLFGKDKKVLWSTPQ
jgi:hypothetical protein